MLPDVYIWDGFSAIAIAVQLGESRDKISSRVQASFHIELTYQ